MPARLRRARPDQPTLLTERELPQANALRRSLRIHVYGTGVPAPVESAEDMAERHRLPAWLRHNLLEAGYHELTRVQMHRWFRCSSAGARCSRARRRARARRWRS